ncbi:hypothetical protein ABIE26_001784 [Pedobacter africanus]|uniref:Uncharacterized protein n=1 Tax=Pedobacter africanus TaxID=151894 RepID=A0ACC6KRH7_9SPHI|nr:DUF5077 domain-containing protein [Pedobacter africanus]MDR6781728.1 hypothetical protein [Pedobacter africanus]
MKNQNLIIALMLFMAMITLSCKKAGASKGDKEKPLPVVPTPVNPNPAGPSLIVPMAGNAFVTTLGTGGSETVTGTKMAGWTNPNSIFTAYFRLGIPGSLSVKMKASVPSGSSVVKLSINGTPFTINLSGATYTTYDVGTLNVTSAGYVKVDFQGVSKTSTYFADVSDLEISGTATASNVLYANDANNFYWSRRGPSVHLKYPVPANTEWFYSELTVPAGQDNIGSYFMSNGFDGGYFGIQVNSATERRVLFSVWNPANGTTTWTRKGADVVATTFTGEGEGGQSYLLFNWVAGNTYKFLTQAKPDGQGNTLFSSWFFAPELNQWRFMVTWKRPNTNTYLTGVYSFLENFRDVNGYMGRKAEYHNQWARTASGMWTELTSANFTGDATVNNGQRKDYAAGVSNGRFYMQNGGFFADFVEVKQTFTRTATGTAPVIDFNSLP